MMTKRILIFLLLTPLLLSCHIDHGLGVLGSRIQGKLIFVNDAEKPEYVESVRVVAVVNVPPTTLGDVVITNTSVNLSEKEPEYYIPAPLGTYQLVVAVYKVKGKEWDYLKWLSYYGLDPVNFKTTPIPVTLSKAQPIVNDVNILCDWSLLPKEVK